MPRSRCHQDGLTESEIVNFRAEIDEIEKTNSYIQAKTRLESVEHEIMIVESNLEILNKIRSDIKDTYNLGG